MVISAGSRLLPSAFYLGSVETKIDRMRPKIAGIFLKVGLIFSLPLVRGILFDE
jgi:hypothetical protein